MKIVEVKQLEQVGKERRKKKDASALIGNDYMTLANV